MSALLSLLRRLLTASGRRGSVLLAAAIVVGLAVPPLAHLNYPTITANVMLNTTLIMLRLDLKAGLAHLRRPGRLTLMTGFMMIAAPLITAGVVHLLPLDPGIASGMVVFTTGAGVISGAAVARLAKLDAELALLMTMISTVLVPFVAPPMAVSLAGVDLALTVTGMMTRLGLVVGVPILVAIVITFLVGRKRLDRAAPLIDGAVVWLMIQYGVAVMDGITARILADPWWVAQAVLAIFGVSYGLNLLSTLVFGWTGRLGAASFGLMSGNRNMALYLAVLPTSADPRIGLFFGLCLLPVYFCPMLLTPVYRRFLKPAAPRA